MQKRRSVPVVTCTRMHVMSLVSRIMVFGRLSRDFIPFPRVSSSDAPCSRERETSWRNEQSGIRGRRMDHDRVIAGGRRSRTCPLKSEYQDATERKRMSVAARSSTLNPRRRFVETNRLLQTCASLSPMRVHKKARLVRVANLSWTRRSFKDSDGHPIWQDRFLIARRTDSLAITRLFPIARLVRADVTRFRSADVDAAIPTCNGKSLEYAPVRALHYGLTRPTADKLVDPRLDSKPLSASADADVAIPYSEAADFSDAPSSDDGDA
jgi:hypothetical protein